VRLTTIEDRIEAGCKKLAKMSVKAA